MENNMTEKVITLINQAGTIARDHQSQEIDVPHLLKAMIDDPESMPLLK